MEHRIKYGDIFTAEYPRLTYDEVVDAAADLTEILGVQCAPVMAEGMQIALNMYESLQDSRFSTINYVWHDMVKCACKMGYKLPMGVLEPNTMFADTSDDVILMNEKYTWTGRGFIKAAQLALKCCKDPKMKWHLYMSVDPKYQVHVECVFLDVCMVESYFEEGDTCAPDNITYNGVHYSIKEIAAKFPPASTNNGSYVHTAMLIPRYEKAREISKSGRVIVDAGIREPDEFPHPQEKFERW